MKKGFILPLVLIIMAMLLGVSAVLSKLAEQKTRSLKAQEVSYYSGKEIVIELDEKNVEKDPPGKKVFQDVINLYGGGDIKFISSGHTKKSTNGRFASISSNADNSCQVVGGVTENNLRCVEDNGLLVSGYTLPSIDFGTITKEIIATETLSPGTSYEKLTIKGTAIFPQGVYYVKTLVVDTGNIIINPNANVKIYSEGIIDIKGNINVDGDPSQLLVINKGTLSTQVTKITVASRVKGFFYTSSQVALDDGSEMYGALATGGLVQLNSSSFIEYDEDGAGKFLKEHITEREKINW